MQPKRFAPRRGPVLQALGRHGTVVTIGNYDGVHLGHQAVLCCMGLGSGPWVCAGKV
ncbi:MAG: hypothetical protein LC799_08425 [Actinobacteria bacterium]|nr:hypothetical protein [Actinomycetota bacterium]